MERREFLQSLAGCATGLWQGPSPAAQVRALLDLPASDRAGGISIDGGRQLFVDDHLVDSTTLPRVFHQAAFWDRNPVLQPDRPWEEAGLPTACAMPFSDGVVYDPESRLYKLWYLAGLGGRNTCLATSTDGREWQKPDWKVVGGTNIVWPAHPAHGRDSHTVVRDPLDREWPFKMGSSSSGRPDGSDYWLLGSRDGVRWTRLGETPTRVGDRTTIFYNPFRKKWVFSVRTGGEVQAPPRHRLYQESDTFVPRLWSPKYWVGADPLDAFNPIANGSPPQLYNLDCVAYEGLLLGLFTIFRGDLNDRPKLNDLCVGFSRDGLTWHRPDRRPFIGLGAAGSWNFGNVQSAGGCCVVMGDQLGFFVSGRAGIRATAEPGRSSTGLALLRRDGFASMEGTGSLTTRPIVFSGRQLFVNAAVDGELRAEILDVDRKVLVPADACVPVKGDSTRHVVRFTSLADLQSAAGRPLRLRFRLERAKLFAFWVSDSSAGRSGGYLAAGGPEMNVEGRDVAYGRK